MGNTADSVLAVIGGRWVRGDLFLIPGIVRAYNTVLAEQLGHARTGCDIMSKRIAWKRAALWAAGLVCVGAALTACTTSRDQYRDSSNISTYGVVDVGIERTSR